MACLDFGFVIESSDLVVFLQAYFDESGKGDQQNIASFCGFAAVSESWGRFHEAWMHAVAYKELHGPLKAADVLRYRRALSPKIPAQTPDERADSLAPFVDAILSNVAFGLAIAIDCRAFRSLPESDQAILGHDPHYWAFQQALLCIKRCAEERFQNLDPDIQVGLCCDEEEKTSIDCLRLFINIRRTYPELRKRFVSIGFADDKFFPQIQAADLIASVARQQAEHQFHGTPFDMEKLYEMFATPTYHPGVAPAPVVFNFMGSPLIAGIAKAEREGRKRKS